MTKIDEINAILNDEAQTMPEALGNLARQSGHPHPVVTNTPDGIANVYETLKDNLKPENIKAGVNILGCFGTLEGGGASVPVYAGSVKVEPTTKVQTLATAGKVVQQDIHVGGAKASVDPNIKAENIKTGVDILGVHGIMEEKLPPYQGEYRVYPASIRQVLPTSGKSLATDIEIEPVAITENLIAEIVEPMGSPSVELVWNDEDALCNAEVDMPDIGNLRSGLHLISHVGTKGVPGRLNLTLGSYQEEIPLTLGARTTEGITSSLFVYFDTSFFQAGQRRIAFTGGGATTCVLSMDTYDTPSEAARFDWIITDEDATEWLEHLSETLQNRKYVRFMDGNMVSSEVKQQYSAKGYTVLEELI